MQTSEIALLQVGDIIDFRTKRLTASGLVDGGIESAQVVGTTDQSALIKNGQNDKFPGLTIAVQAHNIVAAFRLIAGDVVPIFVDIPGEGTPKPVELS